MPSSSASPSQSADNLLQPRADMPELRQAIREDGVVIIDNLFEDEFARRLYQRLKTWVLWNLVTRIQGQHREFDGRRMEKLNSNRKAPLEARIVEEAQESGFQYYFERYPLYDQGRAEKLTDPVLASAYQLLRSDAFLNLGRQLTEREAIQFADGQATRYRRGHFLTKHTDFDQNMKRVAAYVINLTPAWRADYGGQLQFLDQDGNVEKVIKPVYNCMTLFKVPRPHLVSVVAPFVTESRLAITGWFRAEPEAEPEVNAA